jgi:phosphatidate cytidylyltransferase
VDEHDEDERLSKRPPAEGVRIIRAEEAQAALDAGQAAGRRPDDQPRYGDVPPAPSGPRPPHRFPLPDSVDPASAVPRPPVRTGEVPGGRAGSHLTPVPGAPLDRPGQDGGRADRPGDPAGDHFGSPPAAVAVPVASAEPPGVEEAGSPFVPPPPAEPDLALPEEGISLRSPSGPPMPHWTDPPTGEIPRIGPEPGAGSQPDDLDAWQALGARGLRWRDGAHDWDEVDDVGNLGDNEPRLGALNTTRTDHSDLYSFDEQFERLEEERSGQHPVVEPEPPVVPPPDPAPRAGSGASFTRGVQGRRGGPRAPRPPANGGRDLTSAVLVGIALIVVLGVAYLFGAAVMMLLSTVVVVACALELYNIIQRSGFRPATLLGLSATVAVMLAGYWRGEQALPLVLVLMFMTSMLWYVLEVVDARPMVNVAVTVMAFAWVGLLGSYASLLLRVHNGKGMLLGAVLVTVAADIVAYAAGSQLGSHLLAPSISPGKTWEGVVLGGIGAVVVGGLIVARFAPWSTGTGLRLGLVVAVVAPVGDLCESMIKRDLHLKDSGSLLPGHGGLLDRFDALLFVLPATYYLAQYLRLH